MVIATTAKFCSLGAVCAFHGRCRFPVVGHYHPAQHFGGMDSLEPGYQRRHQFPGPHPLGHGYTATALSGLDPVDAPAAAAGWTCRHSLPHLFRTLVRGRSYCRDRAADFLDSIFHRPRSPAHDAYDAPLSNSGRLRVGALGLYARYAVASIKGQMQYPASFVMLTIGQFLSTIVEFIGVAALFARFQ